MLARNASELGQHLNDADFAIMRTLLSKILSLPMHTEGESTSEESSDEETVDPGQASEQKMRILALNAKDFKLPQGNVSLADLNVRQAAYSMAGCVSYVLPTDLLEIGGEMDSWTAISETRS